jgi:glycine betaine/proline transport system substrate-binding protein
VRLKVMGALVAVALVVASCGDSTAEQPPAEQVACVTPGGEKGITLAVHPWPGSLANASVAKAAMECRLGIAVKLVEVDEYAAWPALASGTIDATLEVWPSRHGADYQEYVAGTGAVRDLGALGPVGRIGWYVPTFVLGDDSAIGSWQGLLSPERAQVFAEDDDDKIGVLLSAEMNSPSFAEEIIGNLGLPLRVETVDVDDVVDALDESADEDIPILVELQTPHWKQDRVDLTEVRLPDVTTECVTSGMNGDGRYRCGYAPDVLYKAASSTLANRNARVFAFLQQFQLTAAQQNEIAAMIEADDIKPEAAAQKWVADNATVVDSWVS